MLNNEIIAAKAIDDHRLRIRWSDGFKGDVDFADLMKHGILRALRDPALFRNVHVDPQAKTILWTHPEGQVLDFCPDALRAKVDSRVAEEIDRLNTHDAAE